MDGLTFYKILYMLSPTLEKAELNGIYIAGGSVYLSFYKGGKINLEFRAAPAPPLLRLVSEVSGESPGALSAVSGARVTTVSSFGWERAGYVELKKRKASGKLVAYKAVMEPAGNYANFFLLDDKGVILYSLSSRTIDPDRNIGAGFFYALPRPNKAYSLDNFQGAVSFSQLSGFYPATAKHGDELLKIMSFDEAAAAISESLRNDDRFYIDKSSKVIPFFIPNPENIAEWKDLSPYFAVKEGAKERTGSVERIKKIFSHRRDKYLRLAEKLEGELLQAKKADMAAAEAELIKNNLHKIKGPGDYVFQNYTAEGAQNVPYSVAYGEDIAARADKLFKKAARLKKSVPIIEERLRDTFQMALFAEEQLYYAENLNSPAELADFERLIAAEAKGRVPKKDKKTSRSLFYEEKNEKYSLFVGRSSVSNHELVFRYGKDGDIWFHGRGYPSAHVLLRLEGGAEVTEDLLVHAARVTAYFSKMRGEVRAEVDYALRKYVNKPKNTPPGFVTYKRFKTIAAAPYTPEEIAGIFGFS